ncbi:helix-turn-helix domain-containing protein [Accumulibacter sp.]|uniref:helix-turn-helix domain-containing protein n=1 Tax=Accumulibacter sp. TaxID=2053492 RepID=UPI0025D72DC0|nr:helix-turn-helix domain-containing protein [Accumulibacter sp.]MCM8594264.1 helix-turn-helix domain-containing protein [Accumulibacter sp.]MDS4048408.1 helix-turn-helix domain-containing protein [Accumulibacter sp.]
MISEEDILTLQELSAWLKISERTLYGYAQKGIIPGIKIGSAWRFRRVDIDAWLEEQRKLTESSRDRDKLKKLQEVR